MSQRVPYRVARCIQYGRGNYGTPLLERSCISTFLQIGPEEEEVYVLAPVDSGLNSYTTMGQRYVLNTASL